jgi:tetratricopeptide (TPR) repeat protein
MDLRIEDDPEPIKELRRLMRLRRAYDHMNAGDLAVEKNDMDGAVSHYGAAEAMVPDMDEFIFWHAVTLAQKGRLDDALPLFRKSFLLQPGWHMLVKRLPMADLLPKETQVLSRILAVGPKAE